MGGGELRDYHLKVEVEAWWFWVGWRRGGFVLDFVGSGGVVVGVVPFLDVVVSSFDCDGGRGELV